MDHLSYYKSPPRRVVLGHLNNNNYNESSPISPMANLKLLTKVATSHFPMEKPSDCNLKEGEDPKTNKISRRSRSLSFICEKFLEMYSLNIPEGDFRMISLGNLASCLGIEKRRVYDIINVVASLKMAVRICKDKYKWYGSQRLVKHLLELKSYALRKNIDKELSVCIAGSRSHLEHDDTFLKGLNEKNIFVGPENTDNRIGVLCQKFMMMFLICEKELDLVSIAKLILTPEQGKTGMRRLYDVSNVLETLGLIRKRGKINKKPSFVYSGPTVEVTRTDLLNENLIIKNPFKDHCDCDSMSETSSSDTHDLSAESSCDGAPQRKIDSILEVICTELEKFDDDGPKAKRRLCLESVAQPTSSPATAANSPPPSDEPQQDPPTFIKAPKQSFRFVSNKIMKIDNIPSANNNNNNTSNTAVLGSNDRKVPIKLVTISQLKGRTIISGDKKFNDNNNEIMLNRIQQPIKLIRPGNKLIPFNIQAGSTFRVVKSGDVMKLVKCEMDES